MINRFSQKFIFLQVLLISIFCTTIFCAQAQVQVKEVYGKDTIKAFKIKSIKEFKDDRIEYYWEYNTNGGLVQFIVYSYFGDPFLTERKTYNAQGALIEERKWHEQERYDHQNLYYKDKNGLNVKEFIQYLKPDSQRIEIQLERREDNKIRSSESYKVIRDKTHFIKTIKDSIVYEYHPNQRLKSKVSYYDQKMLSKEIYNDLGKQLEEVHFEYGKERRRSDWKYINDSLLSEEVHYYFPENLISATKYKYNSKGNLLEKIFFETGMSAEHILYKATYRHGRLMEESEYGLDGFLVSQSRYEYSGRKVKVLEVNRSERAETIKDRKSGKVYSIFHFEKSGKDKGGISWKYDRKGRKTEERVYEAKGSKESQIQQWEYDANDRLILYSKGAHKGFEQVIAYDYNKKDLLESYCNCRYSQDTLCDIIIYYYDPLGKLIKRTSMEKQKISASITSPNSFVADVPMQGAATVVYSYNSQNLLIEKKTLDGKGNMVSKEHFEYATFE